MRKRWSERVKDLGNAVSRLEEAIEDSKKYKIESLKDGVIQRFEFSVELSWKTLKNYLENEGVINITTPKQSIREAFAKEILKVPEIWIEMLNDRNLTSHIYDSSISDKIYENIVKKYFEEIKRNYEFLKNMEVDE